jgi:NADPH-dependent 2,4-dienoyl-CoA reductase/sulfur reductase-like enzyme
MRVVTLATGCCIARRLRLLHDSSRGLTRFLSSSFNDNHPPSVAIVGSGPAGFYTAQNILKVSTGFVWKLFK